MHAIFILLLLYTVAFSRESVHIENRRELISTVFNHTELIVLKNKTVDFHTVFLQINKNNLLANPNINSDNEKTFQTLIDIFQFILKDFDFKSNLGFGLIDKDALYGNMLLVFNEASFKKIENREFNQVEYDYIAENKYIPAHYPLRNFFSEGKIYITKETKHGMNIIYSEKYTKLYSDYVSKHMFKNYHAELKTEDVYSEYIELKNKIFDCSIFNDIKCVKKYIYCGYNIDIQDNKYNQTPLMYATANGHYDIVKILIENGANPNIYPKGMENSYLAAKRLGFNKIAKLLKPITTRTERSRDNSLNYNASDLKNMCLGANGKYKEFCYSINDSDLKNSCLGIIYDSSFAYKIKNNDLKNFTFGVNRKYLDKCYLIQNNDLKNACIGISNSNVNCYLIQDSNLKSMCLGISNSSNNCYNIK